MQDASHAAPRARGGAKLRAESPESKTTISEQDRATAIAAAHSPRKIAGVD